MATLLFNPDSGDVFTLNGTGAFVWELHAGGVGAEAIARRFARRYGIGRKQAERDVFAFLAQTRRYGLQSVA
jgi:hypothetical protein